VRDLDEEDDGNTKFANNAKKFEAADTNFGDGFKRISDSSPPRQNSNLTFNLFVCFR
jgi:hypothetical protein